MSHIVVIGAGQAGSSLVVRLRNGGFDGEITLIGAEPVPPYQRPPLSKTYLTGEMALERLFLRPEAFYGEQGITLKLGHAVDAIDPAAKTVSVAGEAIAYDQLVLTTGSDPRRLPAAIGGDLAGVHVVRTLADVDGMADDFRDGARALIVGGGYIGLEAASVAAKLGVEGDAGGNGRPDFAACGRTGNQRLFSRAASQTWCGYPRRCRAGAVAGRRARFGRAAERWQ